MNWFRFIPGYESYIFNTGREPALLMMLAFIITFIFTRGYTRIARKTGWGSASFGGVHAHHLVFGMVISFVSAALMFSFLPQQGIILNLLAIAFGAGVALVLDEFALIFHLDDVYWEDEGRKSVDAVVLGASFGLLFLLHATPLSSSTDDISRWLLTIIQIFNLVFVIISALKGKIFMALFGVFIPFVAIIGAVRIAEPESIWAMKFYKPHGKKMKKSKKRYEHYHKVWRARKEKAWDIIGGKTGRPNAGHKHAKTSNK